MTAIASAFTVSKDIKPAEDAFDMEAAWRVDLASAKVVNIASKYAVDFDAEVTLDGRKVDVKVCYSNDIGEIDVYRLNADADPVVPEMCHWLSTEDYERLFGDAEKVFFAREEREAEAARDAHEDRAFRCDHDHGLTVVHSDTMNF